MNSKTNVLYSALAGLFVLAIAAVAFFQSGCASMSATANLEIATGEVAGGNVYATAKLSKIDPTAAGTTAQQAAVADLQLLVKNLPLWAAGALSDAQNGAMQATLQRDQLAFSGNSQVNDQIASILNLLSQTINSATPLGVTLPSTALAQQTVGNVVAGIQKSINFYSGKWSISNPAAWPAVK